MPGFCGLYSPTRFPAIWREAACIEAEKTLECASLNHERRARTMILRIKNYSKNLMRNTRRDGEQSRKSQHDDLKLKTGDEQ